MAVLHVHSAERYVIAIEADAKRRKVLQVVCGKRDGSIYVTFPYGPPGPARVGEVRFDATLVYPTDLVVGHDFPVTLHSVKYAHHPSGRAHFSLSGKVESRIGRAAVPLELSNGHLFTVMLQGLSRFPELDSNEQPSAERGIVAFRLHSHPDDAAKLVGHVYSESALLKRVRLATDSAWFSAVTPGGHAALATTLATSYCPRGERHYLVLTGQRVERHVTHVDCFLSFMGGFDPPAHAFDHSKPTSCLMLICPEVGDAKGIAQRIGTIDL